MTAAGALLDPDAAVAALASVARPGDSHAEVFAERLAHALYEVSGGQVRSARLRAEQGAGARRLDGDQRGWLSHADGPAEEAFRAALVALRGGAAGGGPGSAAGGGASPADEEAAAGELGLPLGELVAVAREAEAEALRASPYPHATTVTTRVVASAQQVTIARSDGLVAGDLRLHAAMHVEAVVRLDRKVRKGRRSFGCATTAGLSAGGRHLRLARLAAEAAGRRLEAVSAPSGELPVVLAPGGPATLLHEACGHALEADLARHAGAYRRLGERVAAAPVTLVDDPAAPPGAAVYACDDEGEPAAATVLIEAGVLRDYLYDRRQAAAAGRRSNGHGRRLGHAYPPLARMSCTYLAAGPDDPEEIISDTDRGILVEAIAGGDTDMGSGRFNLQVSEGQLIERGRVTVPIRGAVLSGDGPAVLRGIDRVGSDCDFLSHTYLCNKLDQFPLVVSVGQPTVRVAGMRVWGG